MRKLSLLSLSLLSCLMLAAQPAADLAPTDSDTSLLWRISGNGLSSDSYLFGTIHMIPANDFFMPNGLATVMAKVDRVAFEIDTRQMQDPSVLFTLMSQINMRNDTSLNDLLTKTEYDSVSNYFEEAGLPMILFKRMKPLFLSSMVGQDMNDLAGGLGNSSDIKSYELELTELAESGEKTILGLETIEFQLGLFDSIPYRAQAQMLLGAIRSADDETGEDQFSVMVDMYKRQAIAEMANMISEESQEVSRFEELLLTKRNQNWIPAMANHMQEGPILFAVGAGHLGNNMGVIALLRQAGYQVEAIY